MDLESGLLERNLVTARWSYRKEYKGMTSFMIKTVLVF